MFNSGHIFILFLYGVSQNDLLIFNKLDNKTFLLPTYLLFILKYLPPKIYTYHEKSFWLSAVYVGTLTE